MNKRTMRLRISRETLRSLTWRQLGGVAGGGGETHEIVTGCACTDGCPCPTASCNCSAGCNTQDCPGTTFEILSGCATNC